MSERDTIFISHSTPQDNEFSIWIASRLELLGYKVWVDKNGLLGGERFWPTIQKAIDRSIKILFVYSKNILNSDGVLKPGIENELEYGKSIAIQNGLSDFIIPLHIDDSQYHLAIGMPNINHIPFTDNWAVGLKQLLRKLEKEFKEYSKKKEQNTKVSDYYETSISSGRQYFTDRTSRRIKNNTLTKDQLKKINQKDLQSKVDTLNNEKLFMKQNKDVVYSSDDIKMFSKDIDKLLKQYNGKMDELKKKEEEKKKKAEEASAAANSSSDVTQSSSDNNSASVAAAPNNNTQTSNSQYSGNNTSNTTQTQSYNGSNGNSGSSYSNAGNGGSTYHQTYSGGNNSGSTTYHAPSNSGSSTYHAPSTNSNTITWNDYAGPDPSHMGYVGKTTQTQNSVQVETTTGDGGGFVFN